MPRSASERPSCQRTPTFGASAEIETEVLVAHRRRQGQARISGTAMSAPTMGTLTSPNIDRARRFGAREVEEDRGVGRERLDAILRTAGDDERPGRKRSERRLPGRLRHEQRIAVIIAGDAPAAVSQSAARIRLAIVEADVDRGLALAVPVHIVVDRPARSSCCDNRG